MWNHLLYLYATLGVVFGATLYHCQEGSNCQLPGNHLEATTFEFLTKFSQKQFRSIVSLTMTNASVNKIDPKLKYLKNLKYLDLSYNNVQVQTLPTLPNLQTLKLNGNNLKYINLTALPQNIETLDISHNLLVQIPKDWRSLKSLKTLQLYKNPVDCECTNVLNYDRIVKSGIAVPEVVTCHSPRKYIGKDIVSVNCSLDDIMLYDEPDTGSGDIIEDNLNEDGLNAPFVQETEDDDIQENNTFIDDNFSSDELIPAEGTVDPLGESLDEGSGDEGSGFEPIPFGIGCLENCSTPGPIGTNDEEHASPLPSAIDQANILLDDLNVFKEPVTTESTTTTPSTTTPVVEPNIVKKVEPSVKASPKQDDVEVIASDTKTGELERASAAPENSTAVYAIVGVGLFLAVVFVICFIKKRQAKKRAGKNHELPNSLGEELKPLKSANERPLLNSSNAPEHVPLINGQNGKPKDDTPILKTFTPLAHPETVHEEEEPELENIQKGAPDEVQMRQKPVSELLTPPRERVTIKETEIPDSIPKTPLLVHRQRNSDGEIVTTLVP